ncbi:MAG: type II secretion system protein GspE, partial [Myxococcota bacterium]
MMEQRFVGEILVRRGALPAEKLEEALATAEERGAHLTDVLVATRALDDGMLVRALAEEIGIPFTETIDHDNVPEDLVENVPITFARQHRVVPLGQSDGVVRV